MPLFGGSNLDDKIHNLVDRSDDNKSDSEAKGKQFIKSIAKDLSTFETTGETTSYNLAKIVNNMILKPLSRKNLITKLKKCPCPENLPILDVKNVIKRFCMKC